MPQPQGPGEGGSLEVGRVRGEAARGWQQWWQWLLTRALGGLLARGLGLGLWLGLAPAALGASVSAGVSRGLLVLGEGGWQAEQSGSKLG